ncbi:MAG: chorismate mutase [Bacteroidota bacterium]
MSSSADHLDALRRLLDGEDPAVEADEAALGPWRDRIDAIDRVVCALLHERMRCAHAIGTIKHHLDVPVYAPRREEDVLRNASAVEGALPETVVRRLFERIIDETRTLEREASGAGGEETSS